MTDVNYDALDPGIREIVRAIRAAGFDTTDSGDGSKGSSMVGALGYAHVVVNLGKYERLGQGEIDDIQQLRVMAGTIGDGWSVEASWIPGSELIVTVFDKEMADALTEAETAHQRRMNDGFREAAMPLMKWLKRRHPHTKVIVENDRAELVEGIAVALVKP